MGYRPPPRSGTVRPNRPRSAVPQISLPKGGGAIRGIGEKLTANPVTGSVSMSVPIATSPGRAGFGPELSLTYDSSAGNGPFGFGWSLSAPSITRKTDQGLPQYLDSAAFESDVFILSGAEDLVPVYRQDPDGSWVANHPGHQRDPLDFWVRDTAGNLVTHEDELDGYRIRRYRPRSEGAFARLERWTKQDDPANVHWRSYSRDNLLSVYGLTADARIADPRDARRIFSWLLCETRDDRGNAVLYRYRAEDGRGADLSQAHQRNRGPANDPRRTANRYLKHIYYGNRTPLLDGTGQRPRFLNAADIDGQIANAGWMFEVVLDYGEHDAAAPTPNDAGQWAHRPDAFSSYRAGFEVRTTRLCQRVLMFHHFPVDSEVGRDCLVRSTDFEYSSEVDPTSARHPVYTFLRAATQVSYRRRNGGGYDRHSLPPVEFEYSEPIVQDTVEDVDAESLANLPLGLDGTSYRWTDLHGEGIPGVLTEQAGAWFYKRNVSPVPEPLSNGGERVRARFAPTEVVATQPNAALSRGAELMDLAGDGQSDVVVMDGPAPGLFEHDDTEGWQSFRPFTARLGRYMQDPNLKFIDLDGDGRPDVLITEDDAFVWHASLAREGFGPARRVARALDEEEGPQIVFADRTQSIYLADLSGDGLTDLVRIRNGEVCYWPNLGHGRFGAKVTMDNAPWFDQPDQFEHARLRLADIDGSGTTDLIYLHRDGVRLYFNQSGNGWGVPQILKAFGRIDDAVRIEALDLLGDGTACLVWSSPLATDSGRQIKYVSLTGERKPHLILQTRNNLGAETRVEYAPATRFYVQDRSAGQPWITRLPFPVHVVERVSTVDHVARSRFVQRYAYHHGYYDGYEREFRGFGMVEQYDTQELGTFVASGGAPAANSDAASHVPPVLTKSWFHTGVYLGAEQVSRQFEHEYFREPGLTVEAAPPMLLDDTVLPDGLSDEEAREACRALKGSMLRQEVYVLDGSDRERYPCKVTEQSHAIRQLQPKGGNANAAFFTHPREVIQYHYERNPADPRIQHSLTLEVDGVGNVLKQAQVGYGRRASIRVVDAQGNVQEVPNPGLLGLASADRSRQTTSLLTYGENRVTNAIDTIDAFRTPVPCESVTFELTGYTASGPAGRFAADAFVAADPNAPGSLRHIFDRQLAYEEASDGGPRRRRCIEQQRTLFRRDDLAGLLPLGQLQSRAVPGESYQLAFTPGLLTSIFQRPRAGQTPESLLPDPASVLAGMGASQGAYVQSRTLKADGRFPASDANDHWWLSSGRSFFSTDPTHAATTELAQARQHFFVTRRYRDPFGQDTFITFDGDDLMLTESLDALGNRAMVLANDYRVLQPRRVRDANRNESEVAFDTFGLTVAAAVSGKAAPAPVEGDSLSGFAADLTQAQIDALFDAPDPLVQVPALLQDATLRIVYDLHRFRRTQQAHPGDPSQWQPACFATLARDTHAHDLAPPGGARFQISFSSSDGFGREIQKKVRAEAGPLAAEGPSISPRWVGTGWTILNNKGLPVRQYEPFFSATHRFEFGVQAGVSAVVFYDALGRAVANLRPDHSYQKVVFDPWQNTSYDVNDTAAPRNAQTGDPRTDPDISGYVAGYFAAIRATPATWQTWREQRIGGARGPHEQNAAIRAEAHADTPTTVHLDVLGRPFLTVTRNRVVCAGHDLDGTEETLVSRIELDIEGNERVVRDPVVQTGDAQGRIVMRYAYDLLGNRIHQSSMEAGARWMLSDAAGNPIRAWDSRGHNLTTSYDVLRRRVGQTVRGTTAESDPRTLNRDILFERVEYGESLPNAEALNVRKRVYRHFDPAGVAISARVDDAGSPLEAYDFKGNVLCSTRRFASDYTAIPDWLQSPQLDSERFEASTRYDALNRPVQSVAPHSSLSGTAFNVVQPVFNDAGLLERVDVWLERGAKPAALLDPQADAPSPVGVANIDYDAKGQRQRIDYKNGVSTSYDHDPLTFRLTHLITRRNVAQFPGDDPQPPIAGWPGSNVQSLHYTYDPVGNVTHIQDDAQQAIYFRNRRVEPSNDYVYDAMYRLVQGTGREHLGQLGGPPIPHSHDDGGRVNVLSIGAGGRFGANDGAAMGTYVERYVHDAVGNLLEMQHRGLDPANAGWTRVHEYAETSLIEDGSNATSLKTNNRLSRTTLNPAGPNAVQEPYAYDAHGNGIRMPHLGGGSSAPNMHWDYKDQLRQVDRGGGGVAFFVCDASGERVRKVWEKAPGLTEERLYFGSFEIFRRHGGGIGPGTAVLERETLHVMDDEQRIALVETRTRDTTGDAAPRQLIRYQFGNHLGSAALELDHEGQIISYEEYSPFGSSTYQAVRSRTETPKRYRYTGKERDEESGLYYHGARYYAPWLARWTSCDPASIEDGVCLYQYCSSNPVVLHDPSGTDGQAPLPGLIGNNPKVGKLWEEAAVEVLGKRYNATTYQDVLKGFKAELQSRIATKGLGSNRAKGTGINYARETYAAVRTKFGELAAKAGIDLTGFQVHHTFDEIAKNPAGALDTTNLTFRKGHAGSKGSDHNFAHEATKAKEGGSKTPGKDAYDKLKTEGHTPDVRELGPSIKGAEHPLREFTPPTGASHDVGTPSHGTHLPSHPNVRSHSARGPKLKGKGKGIIAGTIVAVITFASTQDAWATVQAINPAAHGIENGLSGNPTVGSTAEAIGKDLYYLTPPGMIDGVVFGLMGPTGGNYYSQRLADEAKALGNRNPFCHQCHGEGGALDPNNEWNRRGFYRWGDGPPQFFTTPDRFSR